MHALCDNDNIHHAFDLSLFRNRPTHKLHAFLFDLEL